MLDRYFIRPTTVDRIRSSWIGDAIERYVSWLAEQNYAARSIFIRVPLLIRFGESARRAGAKTLAELPAHVEPFVHTWLGHYGKQYSEVQRLAAVRGLRGPIQQMLRLTVPQSYDSNAGVLDAFAGIVPGFFEFLRRERGLRETTLPVPSLSSPLRGLPAKSRAAIASGPAPFRGRRLHHGKW